MNISEIRKIDGALLLVFRDLLVTHNSSLTAERLALSQSAISQSLSRLRSLFNDVLFLRRSHGLDPTPRALELGARVEQLLDGIERLLDEPAFDPRADKHQFTISAPEHVTAQIVPTLTKRLAVSAPEATLWFKHLPQSDALDALRRYDVDVAIGRFPAPAVHNFTVERLYEDEFCCVVRRDHPSVGARIGLRQMQTLRYVLAAAPSELTAAELEPDTAERFAAAVVVPHWLTALVTAAQTDLVAICPRAFASSQAEPLRLRVVALPGAAVPCPIDLVHRGTHNAADAWFRSELVQAFGKR